MKRFVIALTGIAALALPSLALGGTERGVVVKVDRGARLVAVVNGQGTVTLVHAPATALGKLRPGNRVGFEAKKLRNTTVSTRNFAVTGNVRYAKVRGMVVSVNAKRSSFALSAHGAVLPLAFTKKARKLSSCGCPVRNSTDEVRIDFGATGETTAAAATQIDPTADVGAFDGVVSAETAKTLSLTSAGTSITVSIPAWFDPSKIAPGEHVLAYFVRRADGTYVIEAVARNGTADEADDPNADQGDVGNLDDQLDQDEQSEQTAGSDLTAAQLALAELADDEAAIELDLHEQAQECLAHVDELKTVGASSTDVAAAAADCAAKLAAAKLQAHEDLQACEQELEESLAGDPEAMQELTAGEQQVEGDLEQSEQEDTQDVEAAQVGDADSAPGEASAGS